MLGLPLRSSNPDLVDKKYIAAMFASGEQGAWYDPSDLSTMYQDAAGTVPVTAVGQPVGRIRDKSGRGNHATQTTTASRPTLQIDTAGNYYLSFDGVDDSLVTGNINFSATDKMTVFAGVRKLRDSNTGGLIELSNNVAVNSGSFALFAPSTSGSYRFFSKGIFRVQAAGTGSFAPAPDTSVVSGIGNISGDITSIRRNGYVVETTGLDQGGENYGNYPLYIGRRADASGPFNGRLYGLIVRGAATDDLHLTHAEKYLAYKSGVSL